MLLPQSAAIAEHLLIQPNNTVLTTPISFMAIISYIMRMRTLSLLRHAKSDWDSVNLSDISRPLNRRGRKAAPVMGAFMAEQDIQPDYVLCSSAERTRQTLDLIKPVLSRDPKIHIEEGLYLASAGGMLSRIRKVKSKYDHILLIAHNPGMHALALGLCGGGDADARYNLASKFPTAALAVLSFETDDWLQIEQGHGHLDLFMVPRALA